AMWQTIWGDGQDLTPIAETGPGRSPMESLYQALSKSGKKMPEDYWHNAGAALRVEEQKKGLAEFVSGWQDREKALFDLAGEVAAKLHGQ
ncbi:MAG TPA: hypothetical protein VGF88_00080, partial [Acidobacteriaceae bacterium]